MLQNKVTEVEVKCTVFEAKSGGYHRNHSWGSAYYRVLGSESLYCRFNEGHLEYI